MATYAIDKSLKVKAYQGPAWYCPSERRWISYDEYRHLPTEARRDAIEFKTENEFIDFIKARDIPRAPYIGAYIPMGIPEVKWNGQEREIVNYNSSNLPPTSVFDPRCMMPGDYSDYETVLNAHNEGQLRLLKTTPRLHGSAWVKEEFALPE